MVNNNDRRNIRKVMENVQHSRGTFEKYNKVLQDIYKKMKYEDFFEEFTTILLNLFITDKQIKNVYVQRSLEFMSKFAVCLCENNDDNMFFESLIRNILPLHNVNCVDVRYHVCEFMKMLLNKVGDVDLDQDLLDDMSLALQDRINDIKPGIRLQAILASQRLQDPRNKDDPIINSYYKALVTETSPLIRKAIIETMAINARTIPMIIHRCLDSNDSVRLASYSTLSKIPVTTLRLEQRQFVLRNGLRSDPKIIELITKSLLPKWLSRYDKHYLEFCKALKLDATEEEFKQTIELLESILPLLFKLRPVNELIDILMLNDNKIPSEMTFETSLFWRCLISFLKKNFPDDPCIEEILPDFMDLIEFIQKYYQKTKTLTSDWEILQESQILNQVLQIVLNYEILDSMQRERTHDFITSLITDAFLHYDNIVLLCKIFEKIEPDLDVRSQEICMIVSNISDPLIESPVEQSPSESDLQKRNLRIAPLRVKLNEMREDMNEAIARQEFQLADKLKNEISLIEKQIEDIRKEYEVGSVSEPKKQNGTQKTDIQIISKCMDVLIAFLSSSKMTELTPSLKLCMTNFVKENLITIYEPNSDCKALKCYGMMCIFDKKEALSEVQIFCQQLLLYHYHNVYNQSGLIISAKIVTDFLLLHGPKIFGDEEYQELEATKRSKKSLYDTTNINDSLEHVSKANLQLFVEILSDMLDDPNGELREIGGACLIKLLYHNVIKAPGILSKLIIKWFNPATEKDSKLRQMIGIFFSMYVTEVPGSHAMVEKAFFPTLTTVINAPQNSPLADIDLDSVLKFMVDLCRPQEQLPSDKQDVHKNLAVKLCSDICNRPNHNTTPVYIRTLLYLDVPFNDPDVLEDLKSQATKILSLIDDKMQKNLKKQIEKYISKLDLVDFDPIGNTVNNEESNLTESMAALSVQLGKRKRDEKNDASMETENDENQPDSDELLIENVNSDEEVDHIEKESIPEKEPSPPRRSLRKAARLRT